MATEHYPNGLVTGEQSTNSKKDHSRVGLVVLGLIELIASSYLISEYIANRRIVVNKIRNENQIKLAEQTNNGVDLVDYTTKHYIQNAYFGDDIKPPFALCGLTITEDKIVDTDNDPNTPDHSFVKGISVEHCIKDTDKLAMIMYNDTPIVGEIIGTKPLNGIVPDPSIEVEIEFPNPSPVLSLMVDHSELTQLTVSNIGDTLQSCSYPQHLPDIFCTNSEFLGFHRGYYVIKKVSTHGESGIAMRNMYGDIVCTVSRVSDTLSENSDTLCSPVYPVDE